MKVRLAKRETWTGNNVLNKQERQKLAAFQPCSKVYTYGEAKEYARNANHS
jgi:hypothetical protein